MLSRMAKSNPLSKRLLTTFDLLLDALKFIRLSLQPRCTLAAENLFVRKQLALYLERKVRPRQGYPSELGTCSDFNICEVFGRDNYAVLSFAMTFAMNSDLPRV